MKTPLNQTEVFQLYIRMCNASKLYTKQQDIDTYILSILKYIEYHGFKPFSTIKGETNYPVAYDCNCINKFRIQYNLSPYQFIENKGVL